jgi:hypothetical protein
MRVAMRSAWTLARDVSEAVVHEVSDEVVDDPVVALSPFVPGRDELEVPEERQLVADRGHREPQRMGEIADAELVVRQGVHQSKPEGVAEGEEHLHRFGRHLGGRQLRAQSLHFLLVVDIRKA